MVHEEAGALRIDSQDKYAFLALVAGGSAKQVFPSCMQHVSAVAQLTVERQRAQQPERGPMAGHHVLLLLLLASASAPLAVQAQASVQMGMKVVATLLRQDPHAVVVPALLLAPAQVLLIVVMVMVRLLPLLHLCLRWWTARMGRLDLLHCSGQALQERQVEELQAEGLQLEQVRLMLRVVLPALTPSLTLQACLLRA